MKDAIVFSEHNGSVPFSVKCICVGHMYKMDLGCRTLILAGF
jgi:hypothetical protein